MTTLELPPDEQLLRELRNLTIRRLIGVVRGDSRLMRNLARERQLCVEELAWISAGYCGRERSAA